MHSEADTTTTNCPIGAHPVAYLDHQRRLLHNAEGKVYQQLNSIRSPTTYTAQASGIVKTNRFPGCRRDYLINTRHIAVCGWVLWWPNPGRLI